MTIIASVGSAFYAPQTITIPFSLTSNPAVVQVTLNRAAWPAGLVAKAGVAWSNGNTAFAWVYGGANGPVVQGMGVPAGVTTGSVQIEVAQGASTSVLVETL